MEIAMSMDGKEKRNYDLGDIVEMKKPHACQTNRWQIIRMGADIKIKCTNCGHIVMMARRDFEKKMKKILEKKAETEA
jgi:hypothetical protein